MKEGEEKNLVHVKGTGIKGKIVKFFKYAKSYQYKIRVAPRTYIFCNKKQIEPIKKY